MSTFTVSDYLLTRLHEAGLGHLFAVPGDYDATFLDACDAFDGITRVPTVNELGAGYAADGYGRLAGIGATLVQYGVGTFSLLNATAGSYVEHVPTVVVVGSPSTEDRQVTRREQVLYHHSTGNLNAGPEVFGPVTVAAEIIRTAEEAPAIIDRAMTALLTHRRPIYLEVYQNLLTTACARPEGDLRARLRPSDPDALEAAVQTALQRMTRVKHCVLWGGVQLDRFGLTDDFQSLVDTTALPFTTTLLGKTVLDERQDAYVGTYAGPASHAETSALVEGAGCLVALGTLMTDDYLAVLGLDYDRMVLADDRGVRIGQAHYHDVRFEDFVTGLLAAVQQSDHFPVADPARVALPTRTTPDADTPLTYTAVFDTLGPFLEADGRLDETVLVLGESSSLYTAATLDSLPRRGFVADAAWGSLGHETGCAAGVALASGKRPLVVAGDGGFQMMCQAVSTLARAEIPAVVLVMSNGVYAIEQAFVDIDAFCPGGAFAPYDVLPTWDYRALATAFGAAGHRAETVGELSEALAAAFAETDRPTLVEVVIPEQDLSPEIQRLAHPDGDPCASTS